MTSLSDLKQMALHAIHGNRTLDRNGGVWIRIDGGDRRLLAMSMLAGDADADLVTACDPQMVLKLIAAAEAAKEYLEATDVYPLEAEPPTEALNVLDEAGQKLTAALTALGVHLG